MATGAVAARPSKCSQFSKNFTLIAGGTASLVVVVATVVRVCGVVHNIFNWKKREKTATHKTTKLWGGGREEGDRGSTVLQRLLLLLLRINNNKMRRAVATTKKYATKNMNANIASE